MREISEETLAAVAVAIRQAIAIDLADRALADAAIWALVNHASKHDWKVLQKQRAKSR